MKWQYRHSVLTLCIMAFFATYFSRLSISPIIPLITSDFGISNTLIGLALSGMWLAYGIAQFPSGILGDRYGEKAIILLSVGGTTLMSVLLALAPTYSVFVLVLIALGAVAGLHYVVATTLLAKTFDDLGVTIGLHSIGGPLAGLLAPGVAAWVGVQYGWRPAIALTAFIGIPIFVLFLWVVRPTEPRQDRGIQQGLDLQSLITLLSRPTIAFPLIIATTGTYVVQGLMSFLPAFLIASHDYSTTAAGITFSVFFVIWIGAMIILGRLSDSYGRDVVISGSMLVGSVGLALIILTPRLVVMGIGIIFIGIGSSFFAAIDPRFMEALALDERGTKFGLVRAVYTVFGAVGSVGVGFIADVFGWNVAFSSLAILFLCSSVALIINRILKLGY